MAHHPVEVVRIGSLEKHPDADSLSVVRVRGFTACVRTADWRPGDLAAYIEPDSVVDTARPEFAFLKDQSRIKVRKMRGVPSMGLLIKAPAGSKEGDDVAALLGVTHYEPVIRTIGGEPEDPPAGRFPVFDVENGRRYSHLIATGEPVRITEKIHGANGRFTFQDGRFWCGARSDWRRREEKNLWWTALEFHPELKEFLQAHPDLAAYAEVYGQVQSLQYGRKDVRLVLFDLWRKSGAWVPATEFTVLTAAAGLPTVPVVFEGPCPAAPALEALAEGRSLVPGADHVREGIVLKPLVERTCPEIGRVILKIVGSGYLEKS